MVSSYLKRYSGRYKIFNRTAKRNLPPALCAYKTKFGTLRLCSGMIWSSHLTGTTLTSHRRLRDDHACRPNSHPSSLWMNLPALSPNFRCTQTIYWLNCLDKAGPWANLEPTLNEPGRGCYTSVLTVNIRRNRKKTVHIAELHQVIEFGGIRSRYFSCISH